MNTFHESIGLGREGMWADPGIVRGGCCRSVGRGQSPAIAISLIQAEKARSWGEKGSSGMWWQVDFFTQ